MTTVKTSSIFEKEGDMSESAKKTSSFLVPFATSQVKLEKKLIFFGQMLS